MLTPQSLTEAELDPCMTDPAPDRWYAERDLSTTFAKGLRVLSAFDEHTRQRSIPDIVQVTGLDRASVRRLVITLVDAGYLEKVGRGFVLTSRVLSHAGAYLRSNNVGTAVQPILNHFAAELGLAISLASLNGDAAIYVAASTLRDSTVSLGFTVGSRLPLLHTAIGRGLLAFGPPHVARRLIAQDPLTHHTGTTLMDRDAIRADVDQIRDKGYALVRGEFEAGVAGLAVPVGSPGRCRFVIGISAPMDRFEDAKTLSRDIGLLQQCAAQLDRTGVLSGDPAADH
ncbi:IclR family transcriptional regulator [Thalassovita sp.]|uniref:IclR family transcriptional regulator n=1 Tax=Thalassovita sp. TaxID=1979401 RepID=UPI002B27736E|nr:IclR family transcriptional regulator C-terminal domain-containing protein [Thalassovita sp.]